jgi:transcriptional regulator with XRE-family HTH domain
LNTNKHVTTINTKRKEIGMTVRALAKKIGMDEDLLGKTLNGKRKMTAEELLTLSKVLGLSFDDYKESA